MNKAEAYDKLVQLVSDYKSKFDIIGVRSEYEVYFLNAKSFKEAAADEAADSLCASITLTTSLGEAEICGFDIVIDINNQGEVNKAKFDEAVANFSRATDEFLGKLATSENKDELIRDAAKREAELLQSNLDAFNSDVKRLQTQTVILAVVAAVIIFIAVFAFIAK